MSGIDDLVALPGLQAAGKAPRTADREGAQAMTDFAAFAPPSAIRRLRARTAHDFDTAGSFGASVATDEAMYLETLGACGIALGEIAATDAERRFALTACSGLLARLDDLDRRIRCPDCGAIPPPRQLGPPGCSAGILDAGPPIDWRNSPVTIRRPR